jgi:hypothetical protein
VNFTREPIIETIITPKEGCKLVVRNSKGVGQEEFFVDALEVVSFGPALFFRSLERPKSFLVPVTDYEVLEVREIRMMLKTAPMEKGIKIGGGREAHLKTPKEAPPEKVFNEEEAEGEDGIVSPDKENSIPSADQRFDKKRDRRRHRRRRGSRGEEREGVLESSEERSHEETSDEIMPKLSEDGSTEKTPSENRFKTDVHYPSQEDLPIVSPFASLLPPPTTLISETIARYRGNAEYKKAFFQEIPDDSEAVSERPNEIAEGNISSEEPVSPRPVQSVPLESSTDFEGVIIPPDAESGFDQTFTLADYPILPKSHHEEDNEENFPADKE